MKSIFKTHTGWVRQVNQDAGLIEHLDDETLLVIVADGMGGHQAGEVASQMAIENIYNELRSKWGNGEKSKLLFEAVTVANTKIYDQSKQDTKLDGMGTTVIAGLLSEDQGVIAHVGDSRVYLFQDSSLKQITDDHSLVNALVKSGQITEEEAKNHPNKNFILRALGTEREIEVDILSFNWNKGDRICFCSDGLSNHMSHEHLLELNHSHSSLDQLGDVMMQRALKLGGDDNITFIIVENSISTKMGGDGS